MVLSKTPNEFSSSGGSVVWEEAKDTQIRREHERIERKRKERERDATGLIDEDNPADEHVDETTLRRTLQTHLSKNPMQGLFPTYPRFRTSGVPQELQNIECLTKEGPLRISQILGEGAASITCKAESNNGKAYAVKILHPALSICADAKEFSQILDRFIDEGERGKKLAHRNIVNVLELGHTARLTKNYMRGNATFVGRACVVMEMAQGKSLIEVLGSRKFSTGRRLNILRLVASGINYLHINNIYHRDIKPHNVIVSSLGRKVILCDLGVCKWPKKPEGLDATTTTDQLTTWKYMPPEAEMDAKDYDDKSDIWSFGVTMAEVLKGQKIHRVVFLHEPTLDQTLASLDNTEIIDAIKSMVSFNPEERPSITEVERILHHSGNPRISG